ncbi:NAD(+) synthase [Treponema phagedenis]|uniref:NAD(+) synthase n=1 Tax=Treponema phagedenis TaxID=162 RepID=UPI0001F63F91|nr:NAD(+) synthase [Treponema phagedenis]EFW37266.1 NAD+ synthase [Treponema phagedenis F0421]TYT79303.1 NAD(+) synthase [Treponema phagedenis]
MNAELGYFRIATAVPIVRIADCKHNAREIIAEIRKAVNLQADMIVFPQLSISSASCGDLFYQQTLLTAAKSALEYIINETETLVIVSVVGLPLFVKGKLYNCSAVICQGRVLGIVPLNTPLKQFSVYTSPHETRQIMLNAETLTFFDTDLIFEIENGLFSFCFGDFQKNTAADLIINQLFIPSLPRTEIDLYRNVKAISQNIGKAFLYVNAGWGESSTDMVCAGEAGIFEAGECLASGSGFNNEKFLMRETGGFVMADIDMQILAHKKIKAAEQRQAVSTVVPIPPMQAKTDMRNLFRPVNDEPFIPIELKESRKQADLFYNRMLILAAQGLAKRLTHIGCTRMLLGISGGLDSSLALLIAAKAADLIKASRSDIFAITMPGFGTTERTKNNAVELAAILQCTVEEISIADSVLQHFKDIGQDPKKHDITYENAQARERTQILMDKANQVNGLVIGPGDLSELALGWTTYNGDHMSMYGVNSSIPKTLLRSIIENCKDNPQEFTSGKDKQGFTDILTDILNTPVSPELLPPQNGVISQKTEHIVGPYRLHDFFLYNVIMHGFGPKKLLFLAEQSFIKEGKNEYTREEILSWLFVFFKRFFSQQYKRSCIPDGPQVSDISLSPRAGLHMPSDSSWNLWKEELENLSK